MNPWSQVYPYPGHYPYHSPSAYPGHTPSPPGYSQFPGDLWGHPLYQMPMQEGPYSMFAPSASMTQNMGSAKSSSQSALLKSFQNKDGTFDINKAMDTAGMMVNTVSQLSKVVKDMSGWLKV
ncbi:YppG family protein [Pseudobacillus badius]|uniref:YppG family protein n=1 Tax=Bacillus badius TaxID=1455 RepID=UPI00059735AA|nr:YppG family protein [Bacillus badius]